jgi:ankyrin repeat protein
MRDNGHQQQALLEACANGHAAVASLLLERGADVNQADRNGATALHIACESGHTEVATLLLEHGADVDQADNDGLTPLQITTQNNHNAILALLLKKEHAQVNSTLIKR